MSTSSDQTDRIVVLPQLVLQQPEEMIGIRVAGLFGQDRLIKRPRLAEMTGGMQTTGLLQLSDQHNLPRHGRGGLAPAKTRSH